MTLLNGVITQHAPDGGVNLEFRYGVFRIWRQEPSDFLAGGLATLPLAPLATTKAGAAAVIRAMQKRIAQEATPLEERKLFAATYILMGLRFPAAVVDQLMKGVLQMKESSTYQAILAEGKAEEARSLILRLGGKRFGRADAETERRLERIADTEQLERMAERLFEAENWKEFWD